MFFKVLFNLKEVLLNFLRSLFVGGSKTAEKKEIEIPGVRRKLCHRC